MSSFNILLLVIGAIFLLSFVTVVAILLYVERKADLEANGTKNYSSNGTATNDSAEGANHSKL